MTLDAVRRTIPGHRRAQVVWMLAACGPWQDVPDRTGGLNDSTAIEAAYATLEEVGHALNDCAGRSAVETLSTRQARVPEENQQCNHVVYVRSHLMPLSDKGIPEVVEATRRLDVPLQIVDAAELYDWLDQQRSLRHEAVVPVGSSARDTIAARMIAAGATIHFPSVLVYREGVVNRSAILGYKTAAAYEAAIARRLMAQPRSGAIRRSTRTNSWDWSRDPLLGQEPSRRWRDTQVTGPVGAYFRWLPHTSFVVYEMNDQIRLLDLVIGEHFTAPGFVDFIPSPDGRIFVTPGRNEAGLEFYDARSVVPGSEPVVSPQQPAYVDTLRPDQYPSIGILSDSTQRGMRVIRYRVLTAWFERGAFRDYEVTIPPRPEDGIVVQPTSVVVPICLGRRVSLPIMSADGLMIGARDEATGTTKVYALDKHGRCKELLDLGIPTGKIAFDGDDERIAFAIPEGLMVERPELNGVFVLDLRTLQLSIVPGSRKVNRVTFPDFTGTGIVYLIAAEEPGWSSAFRSVPDSMMVPE